MGQGDHSKHYVTKIQVPNPIITFINLQLDDEFCNKLQKEIHQCILGSVTNNCYEIDADYWKTVRSLFEFLDKTYSIIMDNILKYSSTSQDFTEYLSQMGSMTETLRNCFELLLDQQRINPGVSNNQNAIANGLAAGHQILLCFAEKDGIFNQKSFLTSPFLIVYAAIYRAFMNIYGGNPSNLSKELELLANTLQVYKYQCIKERLDNIKMLRHQSESYNVHDYSYEAQVRKDVTFGGTISDYYDKRQKEQIIFSSARLVNTSDAEDILANYKDSVKMKYELFFQRSIATTTVNTL